MQKDISIVLSADSNAAINKRQYDDSATIFELIALRAFSIGMTTLYKNAIDALYDVNSSRFYHDYNFPSKDEMAEILDNEEMQRLHALSPTPDFSAAFSDPNFVPANHLLLRKGLGQIKIMAYGEDRQINIDVFRNYISSFNLDGLFDFMHDNFFEFLFPEDYEDLYACESYDQLQNWFDYYIKLHGARTKLDMSNLLVDWILNNAQLNQTCGSQLDLNKLKLLGLSERMYSIATKVKTSKNPIAKLSPILLPQKMDYVNVPKENIKFVGVSHG